MSKNNILPLGALLLAGVALQPFAASAQSSDDKVVSVAACVPRAPNTTFGELLFVNNGVHNPGTQNEQIICPLPRDAEFGWVNNMDELSVVHVHYKTGDVAGKVACTVYVGSPVDGSGASLFSATMNPATSPANTVGELAAEVFDPVGAVNDKTPANVVCTITPKATLAVINLEEFSETQPSAP